jgi:hypothetical protein
MNAHLSAEAPRLHPLISTAPNHLSAGLSW